MALSTYDPNRRLNPDGTPYNNGIAGKPLAPVLDAQGHTYDALKASQEEEAPLPKPDFQESVDELHNTSPLQTLRTYESDIADAVKSKNVSTVKIVMAEETARQKQQTTPKPVRAFFMSILSIVFIVAGLTALGALAGAYIIRWYSRPPAITKNVPAVLTTDSQQLLFLPANTTIAEAISAQNFLPQGAPNSLVGLTVVTGTTASNTPIDSLTFAERLPTTMPGLLSRSLDPNFIVGYQILSTPQPFVVFKTTSYDDAFAGMLAWENTLEADMSGLAIKEVPSNIPATTASTNESTANTASSSPQTASTTGNIPPQQAFPASQTFQDGIISNTNVRILNGAEGTPILIYALPDSSTIIITTNEATMRTILTHLKTSTFTQ